MELNFWITPQEVQSAPQAVQDWFAKTFFSSDSSEPTVGIEPGPEETTEKPTPKKVAPRKSSTKKAPPKEEPKVEEPKVEEPVKEEDTTPKTSMGDVLKAASGLIQTSGENALKGVLAQMGISRVSECPEDQLGSLLSLISVA